MTELELCNDESPSGSRCTKPKGHQSDHHDHVEGEFGCFEMWSNREWKSK
jgi:hypothetical protein